MWSALEDVGECKWEKEGYLCIGTDVVEKQDIIIWSDSIWCYSFFL